MPAFGVYKLGGDSRDVCLAVADMYFTDFILWAFHEKNPSNAHITNCITEAEKDNEFLTLTCNISYFRFGGWLVVFFLFCFLKLCIGYSAEINASFILIAILGGV